MGIKRHMIIVALAVAVVASGCSTTGHDSDPPTIDADTATQLQVRAFVRACACTSTAVYAPTPGDDLKAALTEQFGTSILFLSDAEISERFAPDATVATGGAMVDVRNVQRTEVSDVVGVDVWITTPDGAAQAETVLFRWDGGTWVDATASETGVTVTTSVS